MEWNGMEWNGTNGMEQMEWNGMEGLRAGGGGAGWRGSNPSTAGASERGRDEVSRHLGCECRPCDVLCPWISDEG
jgi:hypothetical protein